MLIISAVSIAVECFVMATDDFVACGIATYLFVAHAETNHVYPHVRGRLVGVFAIDTFEDGIEHGEYLNVTVVIDGNLSVCLKVEGVNHVDIVEVGCCCLVCHIDGVLKRKVPHGESFKLGIPRFDSALMLVVKLTQAYCHFPTTWTWSCNDYQGASGLNIVVATKTLVGVN